MKARLLYCATNSKQRKMPAFCTSGAVKPLKPQIEMEDIMLKRNIKVTFRLNQSEADYFKNKVRKSKLSQEAYIRQLIKDLVPMDMPPPDYFLMMKELRFIGNNLNQIAQKAHVLRVLDVKRYDEQVTLLNKAIIEITNAVMLPKKIERTTK